MVTTSNSYLTMEQMTGNAQYILDKLLAQGWTKNAICGMLGNMQTESNINSGLWESFESNNMSVGFGLVQWTPATNYTNWADENGYQWTDIDGQISRILYEVANGLQWIEKSPYNFSFSDFTKSTEDSGYLALAFINNYERPLNSNQPDRATQAQYWFSTLSGSGTVEPAVKRKKMPIYMYKLF